MTNEYIAETYFLCYPTKRCIFLHNLTHQLCKFDRQEADLHASYFRWEKSVGLTVLPTHLLSAFQAFTLRCI